MLLLHQKIAEGSLKEHSCQYASWLNFKMDRYGYKIIAETTGD